MRNKILNKWQQIIQQTVTQTSMTTGHQSPIINSDGNGNVSITIKDTGVNFLNLTLNDLLICANFEKLEQDDKSDAISAFVVKHDISHACIRKLAPVIEAIKTIKL